MRTELKQEEKVILITRPHWFTIILPVLIGLAGIAGGIALSAFGLVFGGIPLAFILILYTGYRILERQKISGQ